MDVHRDIARRIFNAKLLKIVKTGNYLPNNRESVKSRCTHITEDYK